MAAYVLRRLLLGIPTILGVLLIFFLLFFGISSPQTIAQRVKGEKASKEVIEKWIQEKGYDRPRVEICKDFFVHMLTFDFGNSDLDEIPIREKLREGLGPTLALTVPIFLVGIFSAISISLLVAMFRGTYVDRLTLLLCVVGMSIVYFVYILGAQYYLGIVLRWFPVSGWSDRYPMHFLILPILVGVISGLSESVRFYRTVMVNEVHADYIRTARAKGVGEGAIMFKHLLKNAMIPILTRLVMAIPYLIMGSLLLETFFSIPGLGRLTVQSMLNNDFSTASAMVYIGSLLYILFNILTDISYTLVDPRVRLR